MEEVAHAVAADDQPRDEIREDDEAEQRRRSIRATAVRGRNDVPTMKTSVAMSKASSA